jgi:hypothetical protein
MVLMAAAVVLLASGGARAAWAPAADQSPGAGPVAPISDDAVSDTRVSDDALFGALPAAVTQAPDSPDSP